jgi:hypothetical protein
MNNIDILDGAVDEHACGPRTLGEEKKTEQLCASSLLFTHPFDAAFSTTR